MAKLFLFPIEMLSRIEKINKMFDNPVRDAIIKPLLKCTYEYWSCDGYTLLFIHPYFVDLFQNIKSWRTSIFLANSVILAKIIKKIILGLKFWISLWRRIWYVFYVFRNVRSIFILTSFYNVSLIYRFKLIKLLVVNNYYFK